MTIQSITSLQNPKIKNIVKLRRRKHRDEQQLMIIEGLREIGFVLEKKMPVESVYFCREIWSKALAEVLLDQLEEMGSSIFEVSKKVFEKIAYTKNSDGILILVPHIKASLEELDVEEKSLFLILETVEKPGNLGTIMRLADGAGVSGVVVCDPQTDIYNPNVVRASTGALFTIPVFQVKREEVFAWLKKHEIAIFATTPDTSLSYTDVEYPSKCALVFGSEKDGLTSSWLDKADKKILIPMHGEVNSLNVAASVAIVTYEALRQRC